MKDTSKHTGETVRNFTIAQKDVIIKANNFEIVVGETEPTYTYTVTGDFLGKDKMEDITFKLDKLFDNSKKGSFTITPSGGVFSGIEENNYNITYATGTLTIINLDTTALSDKIVVATTAKDSSIVSDKSASAVAKGTKFVTTAEKKALTDAITVATNAIGCVNSSQDLTDAIETLSDAIDTFNAAIKTGTKTSGGGSSGGGGNNNDDDYDKTVITPTPSDPNPPTEVETVVPPIVDKNGNASVTIPKKAVDDAIKKA